jgi:hypothetical protein
MEELDGVDDAGALDDALPSPTPPAPSLSAERISSDDRAPHAATPPSARMVVNRRALRERGVMGLRSKDRLL